MASLALLVSVIFLFVALIGIFSYILSKINWMPKIFIWIMGSISIITGIWWFVIMPVNVIRFFGLLTAYLGFLAIRSKEKGLDRR